MLFSQGELFCQPRIFPPAVMALAKKLGDPRPVYVTGLYLTELKFNLSNSFIATADSLVRLGLLKDSPEKSRLNKT